MREELFLIPPQDLTEPRDLQNAVKRWGCPLWIAGLCAFALLHALHLSADFPNYTPWHEDWAKYTDEGWYGNAAIRAHLFGNWYLPGDFNPAVALPVWPFLEWLLFFFTGVSVTAARGLAVACFFVNLLLIYWLMRARSPRWAGLLAVTLVVTSPFLYSFSRLAILEPSLMTLLLTALNLTARLNRLRRPLLVSVAIGLLYALMMLTKTTAVFLLPGLAWAVLMATRKNVRQAVACLAACAAAAAATYGGWLAFIASRGLFPDFKYLFFINTYPKPYNPLWPVYALWWSFHGGLWVDHIVIPLAGVCAVGALAAWKSAWGRELVLDPLFGAAVLIVAGYIAFMTYQNHPQPRYFAVIAVFCMLLVAQVSSTLLAQAVPLRRLGFGVVALALGAIVVNAAWTVSFATHPQYTLVTAAEELTRYIDAHPNGNRLMVATSGDEITLITHLPTLCDDFGTEDLPKKTARYQPGWFATWNDFDPGTLADLHTHFSVEQVATFHAMDDSERNVLVLFKLHPLPAGKVRDQGDSNLAQPLPDDKILIDAD